MAADPLFVHKPQYVTDDMKTHNEVITPLMAATGMGGGTAWVQPERNEREALMLESVKHLAEFVYQCRQHGWQNRSAIAPRLFGLRPL